MRIPLLTATAGLGVTMALTLAAAAPPAFAGRAPVPAPNAVAQRVTLILPPADSLALHRLAGGRTLTSADRLVRARQLRPSPAVRAAVRTRLQDLGLRVVSQRPWSVTAEGSASRIRSLFGSARAVAPDRRYAQPLPVVPDALHGLVTAALGGDDPRPAARPLAVPGPGYGGATLRSAYDVAPGATGADLTVGTVQLSGWNPRDLSTYARAAGLPDPVAGGRYAAVAIDGGSPTQPDGGLGDVEVALDQETLLATAPDARQRAYVGSNTLAAFVDAVYAAGDDALSAPDPHLSALSISWGACEQDWGVAAIRAMENALAYATAAGVTVFAASGDAGADDCGTGVHAVDYPASSPYVVGVGGTSLRPAADGSFAETGWSGSGGGASGIFPRPSWQAAAGVPGGYRSVPDIASDADDETGFTVYVDGEWGPVGGTSLASPTSAGLLTDELAAAGYPRGVGDIHPGLYAALGRRGAFRDVTSGSNGGGPVLGENAAVGYDRVTGLGAPQWHALAASVLQPMLAVPPSSRSPIPVRIAAPAGTRYGDAGIGTPPSGCPASGTTAAPATFGAATGGAHPVWLQVLTPAGCRVLTGSTVVDTQRPTVAARAQLYGTGTTLLLTWAAHDAGGGLAGYHVTLARRAHVLASLAAMRTTSTEFQPFVATQGYTYYLTVVGRDRAGNATSARAQVSVPIDDSNGFSYSPGWSRRASPSAYLGRVVASSTRGATASRTAWGSRYTLLLVRGPAAGRADVYLDGHRVRTVDLYASRAQARYSVAVGSFGQIGLHRVTVRVRGDHSRHSRRTTVYVDALTAAS